MGSNLKFLTNNANGLKSSKKRIKLFEYYRDKLLNNGIIFIQETHSCNDTFDEWRDQWKGEVFFSHGTTNSCGVMIGYIGSKKFTVNKISHDNGGRILILEANIDDEIFILVNFYNSNTESEQIKSLNELNHMLNDFSINSSKRVIFAGDFNMIFDINLEASGGSPTLKKRSISKLLQILEQYNLVDIWRIRNALSKRFTFRKNHFSGFIQRRLDYVFISNHFQEFTKNIDILPAFCSDHSPILCTFEKSSEFNTGRNFWKFNSSLTKDKNFVKNLKEHIKFIKNSFISNFENKPQLQWEYLKYEMRSFAIKFSKNKAKIKREKILTLENKLKKLEENLNIEEIKIEYDNCQNELNDIYEEIGNGIKIRSRCDWYEFGEKSNKFFLNLEKSHAKENTVRKLISKGEEINDLSTVNSNIFHFYENLFKKNQNINETSFSNLFSKLSVPSLSNKQKDSCEGLLTEKEIFDSLVSFENNKSPGNDGFTKEFYITFWDDFKDIFLSSLRDSKRLKELCISQRQAIIKLIEKPNKDKRFVENWRPISLLNFDLKVISKALANRLKNVLPDLIDKRQTAYVKNRFIGESGRLIDDIINVCDQKNIAGYLLTIDFEKAFDSLSHNFLIAALKKYGFGEDFIDWIKILLYKQESCVINGGHTTKYFSLERGARQGDPISAYLFVLALEIFFILLKSNKNVHGIEIFNHEFLYTAYADDTTFFLKCLDSTKEVLKMLDIFYKVSGLRPNLNKCEIAGLGILKDVKVALCGLKNIDLTKNCIKILGVHFSYNKKLQDDMNFCNTVKNIYNVVKIWRLRHLSLEGKIIIFKTLAISKIVYLALLTNIPKITLTELNEIQSKFLWNYKKCKIKHNTLCNEHKNGGLKNVDINFKIISLKCSWIKRLYDDNHHEWKIIPLYYIEKFLGKNFQFHSNLCIPLTILDHFPSFYKNLISLWSSYISCSPNIPSTIASQYIWYNTYFKIDNKVIYYKEFSEKGINYVINFFDENGSLKSWSKMKHEYNLSDKAHFKWYQILNSIPSSWKKNLSNDRGNCRNLVHLNHHLIKKNSILALEKLSPAEIYSVLIAIRNAIPTSQKYYKDYFTTADIDWKDIYLLPRKVTIETKLRMFQYKILNSTLYLNKHLFLFKKKDNKFCSYCFTEEETVSHIFATCKKTNGLWNELNLSLNNDMHLPALSPQSAIFGFFQDDQHVHLILNHILIIFKYYVYITRDSNKLSLGALKKNIKKVYQLEKKVSENDEKKKNLFNKKWTKLENFLS